MKKTLIAIAILAMASVVMAADINLAWNASEKATGYKIYQSVDNGATWESGLDVGNVLTYIVPFVPDSGLVLFRVSAYNTKGETITYWSGAWYNGDWRPPSPAGGLGIE